jgi:hypothetical protein
MALDVHVLPMVDDPPGLSWQWEPETGILSGGFLPGSMSTGFTGTIELGDDDGSILVLDVAGGILCGVDVVVWPEITELTGLAAPVETRPGQVIIPSRTARRGIATLEFDTTLSASSDPEGKVCHIRIGTRRPVEPVRVAEHLQVEVDASQRLAGFWLEQLPTRPEIA